jgi:mRNA-degrading endonuclease RelE of RelBE toxin-antitoxin system
VASQWSRSEATRAISSPVKTIRFRPNVPAEVRAIERRAALHILQALHRYAETGEGDVKPLSGEFEGLLRLRVGNHRVLFDETEDTITVHRVRARRDAYR